LVNYAGRREKEMSLLTGGEIREEIEKGRIIIEPYFPENIKEASVELLLSNEFGRLKETCYPISSKEIDSQMIIWDKVNNVYELAPKKSVIGKTKEKITLPEDIAGWITGRGRSTILGLNIHISPGFIQPNTRDEELFFLITNFGNAPISLFTDSKICQLILFRLKSYGT
jgi:dCTP deaminase